MSEAVPYPKIVVCLLLANQFCERFDFYGIRAILGLYITEELKFTEHEATMLYHFFAMLVYTFPLIGAIIADSWWGKYKTVVYITLVYVVGNVLLSLAAVEPLGLPAKEFATISLLLVAAGTGGIKPCVAAFGGDQFVLPQQEKQRETYFHFFYFAINCGSFISILLVPVLRKNVHCFGKNTCYSLAFTVPGIAIIVGFTLLIVGRPFYKMKAPEGNMLVKISTCIGNAVNLKCKSKGVKKDHWLDFAIEKHGEKLVNEIKIVLRVLYLYLPLPLFWALFEQIATAWTFQARRMNGEIGDVYTILPDQMQVFNPVLVLILIPLLTYVIYPSFGVIKLLTTPLQKIATGGLLTAAAYAITAFLELGLESTFPVLPSTGNGQIRIFNVLPCDIKVTCANLNNGKEIAIKQLRYFTEIQLSISGTDKYSYTFSGECSSGSGDFEVHEKKAAAYFFNENTKPATYVEDDIDKLISGDPNVRVMVNLNGIVDEINIKFYTPSEILYREIRSSETKLFGTNPNKYKLQFGDSFTYKYKFRLGGVYTVAAVAKDKDNFNVTVLEVTKHNSIHMLWMVPQYAVITLGECMLSITGIEFAYSEAPQSMKSVLQAGWLLTVAVGQLFVIIIESIQLFHKRSAMFFLYAFIMLVDMIIFTFMTLTYKYVEERQEEE